VEVILNLSPNSLACCIPYQEVVEGMVGIADEEVSFLPQEVVLWT
jgi:hypothetical protein